MKSIFIVIWISILPLYVSGQLNNRMFEQQRPIIKADSNSLFLGLNAMGFVKNNEYFNDIADGYTLFGYQLNPYLSYQASPYFTITAGIYLQKDFGAVGYEEIVPTFSFKYMKNDFALIFGTLDGSLSHRLIEPLYDFENVLNSRVENGIQFVWKKKAMFADVWVDWQNMIYKGDSEQEEILGGFSFNYLVLDHKGIKWRLPLQLLLKHQGGQIDNNPDPLETTGNAALGMEFEFPFSEAAMVKNIRLNNYYVVSKNFSSSQADRLDNDGEAYYLNLSLKTKFNLEFMASYWKGHDFVSIMGGQLYPSVSSTYKNPTLIEENRQLLVFRFMHSLPIAENLVFSTRLEPYVDLEHGDFEVSYGFYINYKTDFFLTRTRKNR